MQRMIPPVCDLDWARLFCLPVGVPPAGLKEAERVQFALNLGINAAIPVGTHGHFFGEPPQTEFRAAGAVPPRPLLPRHGRPLAPTVPVSLTPANIESRLKLLNKAAFQPVPPAAGDAASVEDALQTRVPTDARARAFSRLPLPQLGLDTVEMFFADQPGPWLPNTLAFSADGALDAEGKPVPGIPPLLLSTSKTALGELDRLLLRAPVTGRYRFDPYYIYRLGTANALEVVGPSNTGRLIIEQPSLRSVGGKISKTLLFEQRSFAFDHVARADVAALIHAQLLFQVAHFGGISAAFKREKDATPTLAIAASSPEVMDWVAAGVGRLLRSWVAFLAALRWRPGDEQVASDLPPEWVATLKKDSPGRGDAKSLGVMTAQITAEDAWIDSLIFFSKNIYAPRLAGYTWTEVFASNGQTSARFPVPKTMPPFDATDPASRARQEQHKRLRLIENPEQRWVACWAGAPVGRPAPVYAAAAAGPTFPVNGVTTYELESLHAGALAANALGLAPPPDTATAPAPGRAANLTAFASKKVGYAAWFSAGPLAANPLHTTADWLLELTQSLHFFDVEEPFLDLMSLVDQTDAAFSGHPFVAPLKADDHERARSLRRQMTVMAKTSVAGKPFEQTSIQWWRDNLNMAPNPAAPQAPFRDDDTLPRVNRFPGVLAFEDLMPKVLVVNPNGRGLPSGVSVFDLDSAQLACGRMGLPLPVLLALMETEGVNLFAPVNRLVRAPSPRDAASQTLCWEAHSRDFGNLLRPPELDWEQGRPPDQLPSLRETTARAFWLSFPYGLDRFTLINDAAVNSRINQFVGANVLVKEAAEQVEPYIRRRMFSRFDDIAGSVPLKGTLRIWKTSRRVHWAILSLMAGFLRQLEVQAEKREGGFSTLPPECLPAGASPPSLTVGGARVGPNDPAWKDYLTYYGMLYFSYNSTPASLVAFANSAKAALGASGLSLRDFICFRHQRGNEVIGNVARFIVALDAFLRLDLMTGQPPSAYSTASGDASDPAPRGGAGGTWGLS